MTLPLSQKAWAYHRKVSTFGLHGRKTSEGRTLKVVCLNTWRA